jgi:UDP-N-acetyl-D-glucosamine dehydrogenase
VVDGEGLFMSYKKALLDRIADRTVRVGVVGAGYVGLPLVVELARAGIHVIAVDVLPGKVAMLNRGESYIEDIPSAELAPLVKAGLIEATTSFAKLSTVDAISICVPTPLQSTKEPDMSYILAALDAIGPVAHPGLLVVLESTTYPGTTREVIVPFFAQLGLTVGDEVFIAFSPERIDPGNPVYGLRNTPKIIGGITPACTEVTRALYALVVDTLVDVSSPEAAEMAKIFENTFRMVNIALVNEMAMMSDRLGVNIWEVVRVAATKPYGFMPHYPGPGVGGHCIPIDPHYLSWKLKSVGYTARLIELAGEINDQMPTYVVQKVADGLNDHAKPLRGSRILVLGVAYKPDITDVRESPALEIIHLLMAKGADVRFDDPHVPAFRLHDGSLIERQPYSTEHLGESDAVVIVTHHSAYNWQEVIDNSALVIDTRNVLQGLKGRADVVTM